MLDFDKRGSITFDVSFSEIFYIWINKTTINKPLVNTHQLLAFTSYLFY